MDISFRLLCVLLCVFVLGFVYGILFGIGVGKVGENSFTFSTAVNNKPSSRSSSPLPSYCSSTIPPSSPPHCFQSIPSIPYWYHEEDKIVDGGGVVNLTTLLPLSTDHGEITYIRNGGRLGNQFLLLSTAIGLSICANKRLNIQGIDDFLGNDYWKIDYSYPAQILFPNVASEESYSRWDHRLVSRVVADGNVSIYGFFATWKYFWHARSVVWKALFPHVGARRLIEKWRTLKGNYANLVGVHYRLEDNKPPHKRRMYYLPVGAEVRRLMEKMIDKLHCNYYSNSTRSDVLNSTRFMIVSAGGDCPFIRGEFIPYLASHGFHHVIDYCGGQTPQEDMTILSMADHSIYTIGSFGFYSQFFVSQRPRCPGEKVSMQTHFFDRSQFTAEDWNPPDTTVLENDYDYLYGQTEEKIAKRNFIDYSWSNFDNNLFRFSCFPQALSIWNKTIEQLQSDAQFTKQVWSSQFFSPPNPPHVPIYPYRRPV